MAATPARRRTSRITSLDVESLDERLLLSSGSGVPIGQDWTIPDGPAAGRFLVRFRPETTATERADILTSVGSTAVAEFPDGPTLIQAGSGADASGVLQSLRADTDVLYAEADVTLTIDTATLPTVSPTYPRSSSFGQEWGLNTPNDTDIDAPEAWSVTRGTASTIVAVLDTGIDLKNRALVARLWTDPATVGSSHPVHGWNFLNNSRAIQDNNGHGTHVAGIIAGAQKNGQGIVGVDWNARIMPLKILGADGSGPLANAVSAIYYAVNHGARVINASWGSSQGLQSLADAIRFADSRGVVVVCAAGNNGWNNDILPTYPASYRQPNMLVVAATDRLGNLAPFSDYGAQTVDIAAPGVGIVSTYPGGTRALSGTSMAAPFVSGVVSLLVGLHPDWSAERLVQQVLATAKPLPGLAGLTVTGGIVDAAQALGVSGSGPHGDRYAAAKKALRRRVVRPNGVPARVALVDPTKGHASVAKPRQPASHLIATAHPVAQHRLALTRGRLDLRGLWRVFLPERRFRLA